jgi:hypothetical protein
MATNIAYAHKAIVKGWQRESIDNFPICDSVVGRVHLAVQEVRNWESENLDHKGFFRTNAKKPKSL